MPIDQYKAVGNWNEEQGFFRSSNSVIKSNTVVNIETSQNIIHSETAVNKIRQIWERVPYKFNFFFLNAQKNNSRAIYSTGIWTRENFECNIPNFKTMHMKHKEHLTFTDDAINVLYTNNQTQLSNYMPMTAWMMAHRLEHIFLSTSIDHYSTIQTKLADLIQQTIKVYDPSDRDVPVKHLRNFYGNDIIKQFSHTVLSMRSARTKRLYNPLDYNAELFAQWLLTGSIKFNPVPEKITIVKYNPKNEFDHREYDHCCRISTSQQALLDSAWNKLSQELAELYDLLMKESIGKVLCW